jgi:putative ABC transport system ATP-binding protein
VPAKTQASDRAPARKKKRERREDTEVVVSARHIKKRYGAGKGVRAALDGVSLSVSKGEFVCVLGPSGCGKSTLLGIVGCLDRSFEGELALFGQDVGPLGDQRLAALRGARIGFVFQAFHLLGHLSALANVMAPALFARGEPREDLTARAEQLLAEVGLAGRGGDMPGTLSGGERQRVAIARALLMRPDLLLCDEPTGNLDLTTGKQVVDIFRRLHRQQRITILAVTHEQQLADAADRIVRLEAGKVVAAPRAAAPDGQGEGARA